MTRSSHLTLPLLAALALAVGCEVPEIPATPAASSSADAGSQSGEQGAASTAASSPDRFASITDTPLPDPGDVAPVTDQPREFNAKDPVKGRRSRAAGGYLGAVGATRFYAEHQMIINNIKYALRLYEAEHGNYPKSHEEFMTKIIAANNINLPELVPGEEYIYLPDEPDKGIQIRQIPTADAVEDAQSADAQSADAQSADAQSADGAPADGAATDADWPAE